MRTGDHRPGYGSPLALTSGKLRREVFCPGVQPHLLYERHRPLPYFSGGYLLVAVEHRQLHILEDAQPRYQVEALEDEPEFLVPQP